MPDDTEIEETDDFFKTETALAERPENQVILPGSMGQMQSMANFMATSDRLPAAYQNKPANCFVALEFAARIGCNALMVMQNLDIIQGKPSWSSKFMIAIANDCGKYTPIRYEFTGTEGTDDRGCRAMMTDIATSEKLEGVKVTIAMARAEGWIDKKGSKWKTMPELMLRYRAAAFLIRTYAPELVMGLHTVEERRDMLNVTPDREETAAEAAYKAQALEMEVMD